MYLEVIWAFAMGLIVFVIFGAVAVQLWWRLGLWWMQALGLN